MRVTGRRFAWILVIAATAAFVAVWFRNRQSEIRQAHADFEWFNTLGFPDVKGRPLVNVATGHSYQTGDQPPQNHYVKGFLLGTNRGTFTVLTLGLSIQTMSNTPPGVPEDHRVGFEVRDLKRDVAARLEKLRRPPEKSDALRFFDQTLLSEQAELFALGWACWRNGLDAEARSLYQEAVLFPQKQPQYSKAPNVRDRAWRLIGRLRQQVQRLVSRSSVNESAFFRETIEKSIANVMMWQVTDAFANPSISRAELLGKLQAVSTNYPHAQHHDQAVFMANVLARMLAEETSDSGNSSKVSAPLPVEQQVMRLIFQLRDQCGYQYEGWDIVNERDGRTNTPLYQLVRLRYQAVPQLIAALDSETLTRTVRHGNFGVIPQVLTVGDCAAHILEKITGFSVFVAQPNNSHMSKSGAVSPARAAAQLWWTEFQKKGEEKMLADAIASPDTDAPEEAKLLRERYPDSATACIITGCRAATNSWVRARLVEELAQIEEPVVDEFLKREVTEGPGLESRLAAAEALLPHHREVALAAMLRDWGAVTAPNDDDELAWDELIDFLAKRDSVEVIEALTRDLRRRPVGVRFSVIEALGETNDWHFRDLDEPPSPSTLEAIEKSLIDALEDNQERSGTSGSWGDKSFSCPYISDIAGYFLAERWPDRYTFDLSATSKTRERQRIECMNVWRRAHGLALAPLPVKPTLRLRPADSTRVTLITWSSNTVALRPAFTVQFDALKNKPLRAETLVRLLNHFAARPETNVISLEINASRDEDLTGVQLAVTPLAGSAPADLEEWEASAQVRLAGKTLLDQSETRALNSFASPDGWEDFANALKQAITSPAQTPFEFRVQLKPDVRQ